MSEIITPQQWRNQAKLSLSTVARLLRIKGNNPGRTYQRWESGERKPSPDIIVAVETLSGGSVTASSWALVRSQYLQAQGSVPALSASDARMQVRT